MKNIKLIVAVDSNYGIGKNNDLMWNLPTDMKFFKDTTKDKIVIMGRRNYDSIPSRFRPLPNRLNVVLTRNSDFQAPDCLVYNSLDESLKDLNSDEREIYIIGGGQIYAEALKLEALTEMYITFVDHVFDADTFFPNFDKSLWKESIVMEYQKDEKNEFNFVVKKYEKIN